MSQEEGLYELMGDLPTPSIISLNDKEKESLRPAPLNFSRPKVSNFSRPRPRLTPSDNGSYNQHTEPPQSPAEYTAGPVQQIHQPYISQPYLARPFPDRQLTSEVIPEVDEEGDETDSFGERELEEEYSSEDDAAPPPVIRTTSRPQELSHHYNHNSSVQQRPQAGQGNVWIYKPYAESISSRITSDDASSIFTTATEDQDLTGDEASIAESADTSYTSASDFAFDGRLGWNPRNSSQAERERQRWADPSTQRAAQHNYTSSNGSNAIERQASLNAANAPIPVERNERIEHKRNIPILSSSSRDRAPFSGSDLQRQTTATSQYTNISSPDERPPFSTSNTSNSTSTTAPPIPLRAPRIVKRTSFDQQSSRIEAERTNSSRGPITNTSSNGSNATLTHSTSNRSGSVSSSEWSSSEHDITALSPEKIAKLRKKGINPALYLEMKQVRKPGGKKSWISPLTANTFLS